MYKYIFWSCVIIARCTESCFISRRQYILWTTAYEDCLLKFELYCINQYLAVNNILFVLQSVSNSRYPVFRGSEEGNDYFLATYWGLRLNETRVIEIPLYNNSYIKFAGSKIRYCNACTVSKCVPRMRTSHWNFNPTLCSLHCIHHHRVPLCKILPVYTDL